MRRSEVQIKRSEEQYQAFIRNSSEGIWRFELDAPVPVSLPPDKQVEHIFIHAYLAEANLAMAKMYGYKSVKSVIGTRLSDFMDQNDPENIEYLLAFINSGYKLSDIESHEHDINGRDKYFRNSLVGIVEDGHVMRAWGTQQDVTERRQTEDALRRSEERLAMALRASSTGLWEWNVKTNELYWSDELKQIFGLDMDAEITFAKYQSMLHPADRKYVQKTIAESMKTGDTYQLEHRVIWPNGEVHWVLGRGKAYLEHGNAVRMIGTSSIIDDNKRAAAEAWRQNYFLEILHNTAVDAGKMLGEPQLLLQSILHHAGKMCDTQHGYIYLLSDSSDDMVVRLAMGMFESYMGRTIKYGEGLAGRIWKSDKPMIVDDYEKWSGRQRGFPKGFVRAAVGVPLYSSGKFIGVLALCHADTGKQFDDEQLSALMRLGDLASITLSNARLLAELQESEERFRTMADTAPVLIWTAEANKQFNYFNRPWLDFTGRPMEGQAGDGWIACVHPEDRDRCIRTYVKSFEDRVSFNMEFRLQRYDGEYRWIVDQGVPRFSPAGDFQGFIGSCIDIDDMKRSNELVLANAQLKNQRAQLLAINKTKDEFIALASHQLRTPATAVKQYTSLLLQDFAGPLTPEQKKYVQIAFDSNERQLQIINDLLKTAQIDSSRYFLEKKQHDLAEIIKAAARELETTYQMKNQKLTLAGIKPVQLEVDDNEIKLALINLLENAGKYSYPDTEIKLTMRITAKYVEIAVQDAGVGISKADTKRIFDKFTRVDNELSDTVSGTGFGLYWVKRILGLHGGTIRVQSEVGKGSTFVVRLPQ